jgi:type III secretion system FlhB-like substrate exporter
MTDRPFPPSPRRRALSRRAGLHAASPLVAGAVACGAALLAASGLAAAAGARLGAWIAAACRAAGDPHVAAGARGAALGFGHIPAGTPGAASGLVPAAAGAPSAAAPLFAGDPGALLGLGHAPSPAGDAGAGAVLAPLVPADAPGALLALALPVLAAAAVAAVIAHLAQTRALWLPQRRVAGAPTVERGAAERATRAAFELAGAAVIAGCTLGWLWLAAPRLAALPSVPLAGGALIASAAAALTAAWAGLGVLDALWRHTELARALRMSPRDKREDDRLAGIDPRWRDHRAKASRTTPAEAVAGSTLLLLGDGAAVAIAWDPARRPIPTRTIAGRAARATQLLGLARRHRIPVHRDVALAAALSAGDGPVPEPHWPRLAEIVAAVGRR